MDGHTSGRSMTKGHTLPLLAIRNRVLFPGGLLRLSVGKARSVRLVEDFLKNEKLLESALRPAQEVVPHIAVFAIRPGVREDGVREDENEDPPLFAVGCAARIVQVARASRQDAFHFSILVQGVGRVRLESLVQRDPYFVAAVSPIHDVGRLRDPKVRALALNIRDAVQDLVKAVRARAAASSSSSRSTASSSTAASSSSSLPSPSTSTSDSSSSSSPPSPPDDAGALPALVLPSIRSVTEAIQSAEPTTLADEIVAHLNIPLEEKQAVLEEPRLEERLTRALEIIKSQIEVLSISSQISSKVENKLSKRQRDYYLRQQLKAIREELGEDDEEAEEDDVAEVRAKIKSAELPEHARVAAEKELRRLRRMQPSQPEYTVVRNYLDWVVDLPWAVKDDDTIDVGAVEAQLDKDHYGLAKVKRRIVEYMAVRSLTKSLKGPILCLVGPPGVGKTSLGKSIAQALGRKFHRLSLGGVHDEAEIRGHRRTYIGALPGNILQSLHKAGTQNPVLLLDEIDKLGTSLRGGDPSAALLEVLDPEQNHSFTDHYLNLAFDLSSVFFIATANQTDTIPEALLDRMEIIQLSGYTVEEKVHIAQQYLVPKQFSANGLHPTDHLMVTPAAIHRIATSYTAEAGVRQIERELAAVCRHVAVKLARRRLARPPSATDIALDAPDAYPPSARDTPTLHGPISATAAAITDPTSPPTPTQLATTVTDAGFQRVVVTEDTLLDILGPIKYESEMASRVSVPGVATGLAWKPSGGELLFIECSVVSGGRGSTTITGKLGDVMKESAVIATTYIRARASEIAGAVGPVMMEVGPQTDVHIHVPAGAIPKDGPSAGVAILVALVSLVTGRKVKSSVAMTGEITLRGLVLPVGGIKEKVLAAHRGGITHVVLPARNAKDLSDLPANVRKDLKFTLASTIAEVLEVAFEPADMEDLLQQQQGRHKLRMDRHNVCPHSHHGSTQPLEDEEAARELIRRREAWRDREQPQPPPFAARAHGVDTCGPVLRSLL